MLPDFPSVKGELTRNAERFLRRRVESDPLLAEIRTERHFEGNRLSSYEGSSVLGYVQQKVPLDIDKERLIEHGPIATIEILNQLAAAITELQVKHLLARITEESNRDGTSLRIEGTPSAEAYITIVERMPIDFDDTGKPILPMAIAHPDAAHGFQGLDPVNGDPELRRRFAEVIERKRQDWNDRESRRKLVD